MNAYTPRGEAGRYIEEVVLAYEGADCLPWPYRKDRKGYAMMNERYVSRIVCERAHGPAPTPDHEAAHSCGHGDQACVAKRHLSWKTHAENEADKLLHGTHNRGERHPLSKLTKADVLEIRSLKNKLPLKEVADRFGICRSNVSQIQNLTSWSWL